MSAAEVASWKEPNSPPAVVLKRRNSFVLASPMMDKNAPVGVSSPPELCIDESHRRVPEENTQINPVANIVSSLAYKLPNSGSNSSDLCLMDHYTANEPAPTASVKEESAQHPRRRRREKDLGKEEPRKSCFSCLCRAAPPLLPPVTEAQRGKQCLVIDLDETLVHCNKTPDDPYDFKGVLQYNGAPYEVFLRVRPGVCQFLQHAAQSFELVVFTASGKITPNWCSRSWIQVV